MAMVQAEEEAEAGNATEHEAFVCIVWFCSV